MTGIARALYKWMRVPGLCVLLGMGGCVWLVATESGFSTSLRLATFLTGGRLVAQGATGRLAGPFTLERLEWSDADRVRLTGLAVDCAPLRLLFSGKLACAEIRLERLDLDLAPAPRMPPPRDLTLPFALEAGYMELGALYSGNARTPLLTGLSASLASDGDTHRLTHLRLKASGFVLNASGQLQGRGGLPLSARARIEGQVAERPTRLVLQADGPLERLSLRGAAEGGGGTGSFAFDLAPFAAQPVARIQAELRNVDPARWRAHAPSADLSLSVAADVRPGNVLAGTFELKNGRPARLDRNGLPLERLRGRFQRAEEGRIELTNLDAMLPGKARYTQGSLSLARTDAMRLTAKGKTAKLNPGRLAASWPDGNLNGTFSLRVDFTPRAAPDKATQYADAFPVRHIDADFRFDASQLARQRLAATGRFAWTRTARETLRVDARAAVGKNHALLRGALGNPRDILRIDITAPNLQDLSLPELAGDLEARLALSGVFRAPAIRGDIKSQRLVLPGLRLRGMTLAADVGGLAPTANVQATLRLDRLESASLQAEDSTLTLKGNRRQHALHVETHPLLPEIGRTRLTLAARGGLEQRGKWQGALQTLALETPDKASLLELVTPVSLAIEENGFAVGHTTLRGQLKGGKWQARIDTLQRQGETWSGQVDASTQSLVWIAPLLGAGYQTGGQLDARLDFADLTPAWIAWARGEGPPPPTRPRLEGHVTGRNLFFRALEPGLRLESGTLALRLDAERLTLESLRFDAPHGPLSGTMEPAWRERLQARAATPGQVEGRGHLVFGNSGDSGQLEFHLQRLGVLQNPEQWLTLSGQGTVRRAGSEARLDASLKVDGGYWRLADAGAPRLSSDVRVLRGAVEKKPDAPVETRAARYRLVTRVAVDLGPDFYFTGAGARARLRGSLVLEANDREPLRASGGIRASEGRFDAYGQQLEIEQGILTFNGLVQNPGLNIRAMRKRQAVEAGVAITGTALKPVVRLISTPDVPDAEKLSWLVLGAAPEQNTGSEAAALMTAAHALLGNQERGPGSVLAQLQQRFGVQVHVGRGQVGRNDGPARTSQVADTAGFGNTRNATASDQILRVGIRLATGLTLSYEQSMDGVESVVKLSLALTRHLSVIGQTGSDNALDLFYNYRFGRNRTPRKTD
jgi:translocation and assembly module TamB